MSWTCPYILHTESRRSDMKQSHFPSSVLGTVSLLVNGLPEDEPGSSEQKCGLGINEGTESIHNISGKCIQTSCSPPYQGQF